MSYGFGISLIIFFLGLNLLHLLGLMRRPEPLLSMALGDAAIVCVVVSMLVSVERRVILYEDAIEVAGVFSSRKLSRNEIRGRRMGKLPKNVGSASYYIIVPADGSKTELKLPPFLHVDKCFFTWMNAIPEVSPIQPT